ncbi:MAG TPA: DinB family protein [Candidatus Binatia bacterium]|nr:DinB family protein [Candidatus Binatia bacterium]
MTEASIRAAFPSWPQYNARLRAAVASLSAEQLAIQPGPGRWPLWATIGHLACQRVFWLCVFAREPGAATTRFTDSGHNCPGDDDLEAVLGPVELVEAIDSTYRIVERCLDTWTPGMLAEVISHPEWGEDWTKTRGWVLERVFAHDLWHMAELNEALGRAGLAQINLWG